MSQIPRFLRTVRYLSPLQVAVRARRMLRQRGWRLMGAKAVPLTGWRLNGACRPLWEGLPVLDPLDAEVRAACERARAVADLRFDFLNHTHQFKSEPDWHDPSLSKLWRYNLHYFNYVQDLLVWQQVGTIGRTQAVKTFEALALSWIEANQQLEGDGWHPYTVSLRIVNWIHALLGFDLSADSHEKIIDSLAFQVEYLRLDLEYDVRGNHLIENVRALLFASRFFESEKMDNLHKRMLGVLQWELDAQILVDGGHFERSPTYHLVLLKDFLEIALWLRKNGGSVAWLDEAIHYMLDYTVMILPPHREVPLLKDSAWDAAPTPDALLTLGCLAYKSGRWLQATPPPDLLRQLIFGRGLLPQRDTPDPMPFITLTPSQHYVWRHVERGDFLIVDAGKPCPTYLPAHAQADVLTYELSVAGRRVVVDSGVYEYAAGEWRDYFRSTRAHNTVEVAGQNSTEVYGSFRAGRRARPKLVHVSKENQTLIAEHDGYRYLPQRVTHQREVRVVAADYWLFADTLTGRGEVEACSFVHLHPDIQLEQTAALTFRLIHPTIADEMWLSVTGATSAEIISGQLEPRIQGWTSAHFGEKHANPVLKLYCPTQLPSQMAYTISLHRPRKPILHQDKWILNEI